MFLLQHKHKKGNRICLPLPQSGKKAWIVAARQNITQFMHKDMIYKLSNNMSDTAIVVEDRDTVKK